MGVKGRGGGGGGGGGGSGLLLGRFSRGSRFVDLFLDGRDHEQLLVGGRNLLKLGLSCLLVVGIFITALALEGVYIYCIISCILMYHKR
jgi:hypothetical protein